MPNSLPASLTKNESMTGGGGGYVEVAPSVNEKNNNITLGGDNCPDVYTADIGWLPLVLMMVYIFFFNLGYGAMIFITVAEILPLKVRMFIFFYDTVAKMSFL